MVPTPVKVAFINALTAAGLSVVEATSFVNPAAVPQLGDATEVMGAISRRPGVRYPVLVPNERGFERAVAARVDAIALFTAATDAFCQANTRCTIDDSFERFAPITAVAVSNGFWVRGYVSVAFDCPCAGPVAPQRAVAVAERLFELGCAEVALADTIGTATPAAVNRLLDGALETLPVDRLALHFHDTGGRATDNVAVALDRGISIFDAAAGGLGGCPFAPGAPGNLATETLLDFLEQREIDTGVNRDRVVAAIANLRSAMNATSAN
jgi:isopropylmalate/homocitrate/citramalate synthase